MSAREGQLLPRHSHETESDLISLAEQVRSLDVQSSEILAKGHLSQLDTVSLAERFTSGVGFFRAIGLERSSRLTRALRSLAEDETKLIEEISTRPFRISMKYLEALEKISDYFLRIEEIQKKRNSLRENNLADRWQEVIDRAKLLIKSYQDIHPGLAEEVQQKFVMIRKKYETELDEIDANNSLNDMEKKRRCEQVLDQFRRRIGML